MTAQTRPSTAGGTNLELSGSKRGNRDLEGVDVPGTASVKSIPGQRSTSKSTQNQRSSSKSEAVKKLKPGGAWGAPNVDKQKKKYELPDAVKPKKKARPASSYAAHSTYKIEKEVEYVKVKNPPIPSHKVAKPPPSAKPNLLKNDFDTGMIANTGKNSVTSDVMGSKGKNS